MATLESGPALVGNRAVAFSIIHSSGQPQQFHISQEALADLARSKKYTSADLLTFFHSHVDTILQVAERSLGIGTNGVVLLQARDF